MTTKAPRPPRIANAVRICPECGVTFTAHHGKQMFCTIPHVAAFQNRNAKRGKVAMGLVQEWRRGKHGGTDNSAYAFQQLCKLADMWNAEDRAAGRRPDVAVTGKRLAMWNYADLA